jgi:hypothetical protein
VGHLILRVGHDGKLMTKPSDALAEHDAILAAFRARGVISTAIFGSEGAGRNTANSNLDLVVAFEPPAPQGMPAVAGAVVEEHPGTVMQWNM